MKTRFLFFNLLISVFFQIDAIAQRDVVLKGVVVEWNSGYRTGKVEYLSGVAISGPNAKPTRTIDNGAFELTFVDAPVGMLATLEVYKKDYEVVNKEKIEEIAVYRSKPLKIIMCPKGLVEKKRIEYYQINLNEITKKYKDRIALLEKNDKKLTTSLVELINKEMSLNIQSKEEALDALGKQFEYWKDKADELSRRFSTLNLDDESEYLQQAFEWYQKGDIEMAIQTLESANLPDQLAKLKSNRAQFSAIIYAYQDSIKRMDSLTNVYVSTMTQLAKFYVLSYKFQEADSCYKIAMRYDQGQSEVWREYASFLFSEHRFTDFFGKKEVFLSNAKNLSDSLTIRFLSIFQFVFSGQTDSIQYYLIQIANDVEPVAKNDSCQYLYFNSFILAFNAFLVPNSYNEELNTKILRIKKQLETNRTCIEQDPDLYSLVVGFLLVGLMISESVTDVEYYFNELYKIDFSDKQSSSTLKAMASYKVSETYLKYQKYEALSNSLEKLDETYESADSITRRLMSFYVINIYRTIGGQLLRNGLAAPAKKYLTKAAALMTVFDPKDSYHLTELQYLPNIYIDIANAHINQNEAGKIKPILEKALYFSDLFFKQSVTNLSGYLNNKIFIYYYYNTYYYNVQPIDYKAIVSTSDSGIVASVRYLQIDPSANLEMFSQIGLSFPWQYFYVLSQTQDAELLAHAKQNVGDLIRLILATEGNPAIRFNAYQSMLKLQLILDDFNEKSKDLQPVLYQIWNLENQTYLTPNAPQNYQLEKQIVELIDKGFIVKKGDKHLTYLKGVHLNGLAWTALINKRFEEAIQYAKAAITVIPSENIPYTNLALAYVFVGDFDSAKPIYLKYKDFHTDVLQNKRMKDAFLEDLVFFESIGIKHPDFEKVRALLK